jgi:hypothetical protein
MTWLVPSALAIAGAAALIAGALHLIARSRPVAEVLPTARFIPLRAVHARTRSIAPSDLLLLLLRLAAIGSIGVAVAGPVIARARGRVARVVVVDRSRDVGDLAELRDTLRRLVPGTERLIAFDSTARVVATSALDSLSLSSAPGSLSAALAAAIRAAASVATQTDSVELVVVSPFAAEEVDAATGRIRRTWPGRVRLVAVGGARATDSAAHLESSVGVDDPVVAGLSLGAASGPGRAVRLVRGRMTSADSAWARDSGHVLVHWPAADSDAVWRRRATIDAIGGVTSPTGTLVGRFPRAWSLAGRAIARWADGEPAAIETRTGGGCVRDVGLLFDPVSDVTLRGPFRRFAAALLEPCGGARSPRRLDDSTLAQLAGTGHLAAADVLGVGQIGSSAWTPWLLIVGALLLLVELAARRAIGQRE